MKKLILFLAVGLALASHAALADSMYDFSFMTIGATHISGSGEFTTNATEFSFGGTVIALSGDVNGMPITGFNGGVTTMPETGTLTLDFATGSVLVSNFEAENTFVSLFDTHGSLISFSPAFAELTLTVAPTPTPLPASAPLFGLALIVLAAFGFVSKRLKREPWSPALG